jgi:hypothetical protein
VVADVTILREGVLNGSKGPLFYPADEINKNPGIWNGFPLTANHPTDNGTPKSARSPEMWQKYTIGFVFNDQVDDASKSRKAKAWFDVELANRVDNRIIKAVLAGKSINVSTGLFTADEVAPANATHNGKSYSHIARNYRPDHLAVLLDDRGACSVSDGCGININSKGNRMREQLVEWLVTNCDCWKGKAEVLNKEDAFTEDELKKLKENTEATTLAVNTLKEIASTVEAPKDATLNSLVTLVKNKCDMHAAGMKDSKKEEDKEVKPAANKSKPTEKELIEMVANGDYPYFSAAFNAAKTVLEEQRIEVMKKIVANYSGEEKKAKLLKLKDKSIEDLRVILEFAPTANSLPEAKTEEEKFLANFYAQGANGTPATPRHVSNEKDVLLPSLGLNIFEEEEVA